MQPKFKLGEIVKVWQPHHEYSFKKVCDVITNTYLSSGEALYIVAPLQISPGWTDSHVIKRESDLSEIMHYEIDSLSERLKEDLNTYFEYNKRIRGVRDAA